MKIRICNSLHQSRLPSILSFQKTLSNGRSPFSFSFLFFFSVCWFLFLRKLLRRDSLGGEFWSNKFQSCSFERNWSYPTVCDWWKSAINFSSKNQLKDRCSWMIRSSNHLCSFERIWNWIRSNSLCSMNATNAWTKLTCERSSRWAGMLKLGVVSGRSTRNIFYGKRCTLKRLKVERFWWIWRGNKRKHVNLCAFDSNGSCVLMTFFPWLIEWHAKVGKDFIKGKCWVPLGEYPRYTPTYTTYI